MINEYKHPNTKWEEIKNDIEIDIINDKYKSAEKVPSISVLGEIYNIGRSTAKKILDSLCSDGIIMQQQGVGYFVKPLTKEILRKKHMDMLRVNIKSTIILGNKLVDKEELTQMINEEINNIYSL